MQIKVDPVSQLALSEHTPIIDTRISERLTSLAVQDECKNTAGLLIIRQPAWVQNASANSIAILPITKATSL